MSFLWFSIVKFTLSVFLLWLATKPITKEYKGEKPQWRFIPLAVVVILILFTPFKMVEGDNSKRVITTFDTPSKNTKMSEQPTRMEYNAPDNKDVINQITKPTEEQ